MTNTPQIFFKTVRTSGKSLWVPDPLARTYKIGQKYTFPSGAPAYIYGLDQTGRFRAGSYFPFPKQDLSWSHDVIYAKRAEASVGNRVLICFGFVERRDIPFCSIDSPIWDFSNKGYIYDFCSNEFIVIGEIFPTQRDTNLMSVSKFLIHKQRKVINFPTI